MEVNGIEFRGDRPDPYTEADVPDQINIYGTSKLTGEYLVKQTISRSRIPKYCKLAKVAI